MKKITAASVLLIISLFTLNTKAIDKNVNRSRTNKQIQNDKIQPGVVVLKMKPEFRSLCTATSINEPAVKSILSKYNTATVAKKFPRSVSPVNAKNKHGVNSVDISLIYQIKLSAATDINSLIQQLNATGKVAYAEPLYIQKMDFTPNDPSVGSQYQFTKINAFLAWDVWRGDTNTVIGIVDSGTDWDHPDIEANLKLNHADPIDGIDNDNDGFTDNYHGWDVSENDNNPVNVNSTHGAHVTGCAAAVTDNNVGVSGPAFNCRILPIKASMNSSTTNIDNGYDGIVYAAEHGADIVNCSWGRDGGASQFEQDIVNYAVLDHDVVLVAAAGNGGVEEEHYPASYDNCISVASTGSNDIRSSFSSYGFSVDVCAPGSNILATDFNDTYSTQSGTSMAAPIAAGCAAMIKSKFPSMNALQVAAQLRNTSDNIYTIGSNIAFSGKLGKGRVNLFRAVTDSVSPGVIIKKLNVNDGNDAVFVVGDTLNVSNLLQNLLSPTSNLTCSISTPSTTYLQILNNTYNAGVLGTNDTISNFAAPYRIVINPGTPQNTEVTLRITLTDGAWTDYFSFKLIINEDYINININDIATSITSKGLIGYNQSGQVQGIGLTYQGGETILYDMSLMIGASGTQVSDNYRNDAGSDDADFNSVLTVARQIPAVVSDFDAFGKFEDNGATSTSPINVLVSHHAYAWTPAPDNKYVMVQYFIKNVGASTLNNLSAGLAADWDIPDFNNNKASTDAARKMGVVWCTDTGGIWAAIKLLSRNGNFNHYAIDNYAGNGGLDLSDGFTNSEKYTALTTARADAGMTLNPATGNDVISVVSAAGLSLAPGDSVEVTFALIAGENLAMIESSAEAAQVKYDNVLTVENLNIISASTKLKEIYPNPATKQTHIEFALSSSAKTTIGIYNLLGDKVKDVISENLTTGTYSLMIDVSDLSSGSYFCRMESGGVVSTLPLNVVQ
jgi:serine protease